ncbi:uncharacterized protein DS421_13g441410 [Arachis hypogaea]|nr:uncharacterized protein DS421_13g441410 [Arachis hypogaea]
MEKEISEVQRSRATQRWRKHDGEEQGYSRTCHRTEIGQVLESAARHALESRKRSLHTSSSSSKCILFLLLGFQTYSNELQLKVLSVMVL